MPVELGLSPDARWDIDTAGFVAAAGGAGFSAVGIAASRADAACAAALVAGGVRCHELLALMVGADAAATERRAGELAAAAAAVRAQWVLTVLRVPLEGSTAQVIGRCAQVFAAAGARMAVEFSPFGSVASIPAALEVVAAAGGPARAGVLIDTWHFFRGDSTWEDLERVPLDQIAYVQFDDAPLPLTEDMFAETMNRRVFPGEGTFELEKFADTLLRRRWEGLVSVEVLNAELCELPVSRFAESAYEATARYWR